MKLNKILKIILVAVIVFLGNFTVNAATTGSITIDNAAKGHTYTIYKLFNATVSADGTGISYKVPEGKTLEDTNQWFTKDSAGNVFIKNGITSADLDTPEFKAWATGFGTKEGAEKVADGASVVFSGIPFGYYFVTSTLDNGKYISVDSTMPDVVIKDKNDNKPTIDPNDPTSGKTIVEGATNDTSGSYQIGDKINFQVKFTATNFLTENRKSKAITQYKIVDTPTNLEILKDTLKVKIESQNDFLGVYSDTNVNGYKVEISDAGVMTVTIPWVDNTPEGDKIRGTALYNPTDKIILTYEALVKGSAAGSNQAANNLSLSYVAKEDPKDPTKPTDPQTPIDPKKPDPQNPNKPTNPIISLYSITVNKIDANGKAPLTGAKFKLYAADGTALKIVKDTNGTDDTADDFYRLGSKDAGGAYLATETEVEVEVNEQGSAVIKGLKGLTTYLLEETLAPAGYNKLTDKVSVKTEGDTPEGTKIAADAISNVENNKGIELPSTGGIGRTIFYVVGSVLVVGVVITMISRIKMKSVK